MDLDAIYTDEIRRTMDTQTLTSGRKQVWEDRFQWPLALALICLAAELMLPVTRKTVAAALLALLLACPAGPARANDTGEGIKAYESGDYEKALKHFVDAQLHAPDKAESLYNVANGYYKTGNFDAAADHYKKVLETGDKTLKQKTEYNLGNAEFRRGNAKTAIEHYKAALALNPDDKMSKENLEFVQKMLEQQQKQQQKSDDQQKDQKDRQQDQKQNQAQQGESKPDNKAHDGNSENQQPKNRDPSGKNQTAPDSGDKPDRQPPAPQPEPSDPFDDKQASQASAKPGQDQQEGDPGQAERMLNRLQDQPGRALMPATGGQRVDKDW
jgi:Ca-activated chloride channel family protein